MNRQQSNFGIGGLIAILLCIGGAALLRKSLPNLALILLGIGGLTVLGIVVLCILAVVFSLKNAGREAAAKEKQQKQTLTEEETVRLQKARAELLEQRKTANLLECYEIRKAAEKAFEPEEKILIALTEKPEKMDTVRQFLNYYLPTQGSILKKYREMEEKKLDISELSPKVQQHLGEIADAMAKLYENLYRAERLDLSVEMEAMSVACRRDGLLENGPVLHR